MSLINQALKRAQDAQEQSPPPLPPHLQFRPVEAPQRARHSLGVLVPIALSLVALLLLFLVWQSVQQRNSNPGPLVVNANTVRPKEPEPETRTLLPVETEVATPDGIPATESVVASGSEPEPSETIAPAPAPEPPPPPKPALPKLQGIVWNPARPSAVISGKTLFIGERIGEQRLVAIDQESATLVGGGHTNVLILDQ